MKRQSRKTAAPAATVSLFHWFAQALGNPSAESPQASLAACGFKPPFPTWLDLIEDREYPLIDKGDGPIPDLESRTRTTRRAAGQFYTPSTLITHLLHECQPSPDSLLDPACGDGAFLLELARHFTRAGRSFRLECLSGTDLDAEALLVALGRLRRAFPNQGWPHLERRDFLLDPPQKKFDLIIGNPPYKVNLPDDLRKRLDSTFSTAEGEKDLYTFFLERGVQWLTPGGTLIMLTSHTFLVNKHCSRIREFLFGNHSARRLFLLPAGYFRKAPGVVPVVLEVCESHVDGRPMSLFHQYDAGSGWRARVSVAPSLFLATTGLQRALRPPGLDELFARMAAVSSPLGKLAKVGVGIQESTHRQEGAVSRYVSDEKVDKSSVPTLRGKELEPFRINWSGKYLSYGPHLTYAGDPEIFKSSKILYQNLRHETLSRRLVAALDDEGFFPKNSLSYVCRPVEPFSLSYLTGLLNSRLVNLWFKEHFFSFHVTVGQVRQIPIPVATPDRRRRVEEIVDQIRLLKQPDTLQQQLLELLEEAVLACYDLSDKPLPDLSGCDI